MVNLGFIDSIFTSIGKLTGSLRGFVNTSFPQYSTIIILGAAAVGGYYLSKKYPKVEGFTAIALYSLLFFLILKFV